MIPRHLTPALLVSLRDSPVVFLQGARQTGKSTLVQRLARKEHPAHYVSLDDASILAAAQSDPQGFIAGLEGSVIIDEAQRAPGLALAIKRTVDQDRKPGRFLLTGSANIFLLPKLSESLAGRTEIHTLWPLSQGETDRSREEFIDATFKPRFPTLNGSQEDWPGLVPRLLRGGYPEVLKRSSAERRRAWFGSYITTILERDVRDMADIEGLREMPRLLSFLAARASSLLNQAEIARSLAMPQMTLKRYMALLEAAFLIQKVSPWSSNLGKRLVKSPKLMVTDTGLLSYLLGLDRQRLQSDRTLAGHVLENFVVLELLKQIGWSRVRPLLFHFRSQTGREVDVVLESPAGKIVGIEVKASSTVGADDFRGLKFLAEITGERFVRGLLLYAGNEAVPFARNLLALPVSSLWCASPFVDAH